MRTVRLTMAAVLLSTLFTACNKDSYTTSPGTGSVSSSGTNSYAVNTSANTAGAIAPGTDASTTNPAGTSFSWTWNNAEAYLSNVSVKTVKDGDQAQAQMIELNGRYAILPNPALLPSPVLTTGTYTRIEVAANVQNSATGALTINGVLGEGGPGIPVVIRVEESMQLVYSAMNKVIGASEKYRLAIRVDAAALNNTLNEQDAASARVTGGPVEISKRSNVGLYNKVMQNIKNIIIVDLVRS